MKGIINALEVAREHEMYQVFVPSSIAVFGPDVPTLVPQESALRPTTMYGVTKVVGDHVVSAPHSHRTSWSYPEVSFRFSEYSVLQGTVTWT